MSRFVPLPGERSHLVSPIALLLRDALTGEAPAGRVELRLQRLVANGLAPRWDDVDAGAVAGGGGIWSYPGLGRSAGLNDTPRRHRVLIGTGFYSARFEVPPPLPTIPGVAIEPAAIEFDVHLYNDDAPLDAAQYAREPIRVLLRPNDRYPFPRNLPVVYGRVVSSAGQPVRDAAVSFGADKRTARSDQSGVFALPIEWPPAGAWPPTEIVLRDDANADKIKVNRLGALAVGQTIELQENKGIRLAQAASAGQDTIVVPEDSVGSFVPGLTLILDDKKLLPNQRRFRVNQIDPASGAIRLDRDLPARLASGTPVVASADFTVDRIDTLQQEVTLNNSLPKPFAKNTRVLLDAFPVDVSHPGGTHTENVKVPDGFRNLTIQL